MKKFMLASLVVFACFSIGLAQAGKKVTAQEKKDLFQQISSNDKEVKEYLTDYKGDTDKMAQSMSVKKIDLNGDGQPEYLITMGDGSGLENGGSLCGTLGNCPQWVYRKTGSEYQLLLRTLGRVLTLEKTSTEKFRDLRSEGGDTALQSSFGIYKYDGNMYQESKCFNRVYGTKGKKEKIVEIKCSED